MTLKLSCHYYFHMDFTHSSVSKESACNVGYPDSIPGWWRSPGKGNGNPLQYSCLENPMDRGAWQATDYGTTRVGHNWASEQRQCLSMPRNKPCHCVSSLTAQLVKNLPATLERKMATTPVFLPGKSHGQRSLAGCSLWGCKSQTRLSN